MQIIHLHFFCSYLMNYQSHQAANELNHSCTLHDDLMEFKIDWGVACLLKNRQVTPQ